MRSRARSEDPHLDYGDRLLLLLTVAEKYVRKVLNDWEEQFQPDEKYRGRMLGFLDKADKPLGLNRMTVALERTADIVYSLRSESRSGYVESADREEDCDLWDDGLGVGKGKKSEGSRSHRSARRRRKRSASTGMSCSTKCGTSGGKGTGHA